MLLFGQQSVGGADLCLGAVRVEAQRLVVIGRSAMQDSSIARATLAVSFIAQRQFRVADIRRSHGYPHRVTFPIHPRLKDAVAIALVVVALTCSSCAQVAVVPEPFPGIACHAETRTQPPTRLFVAEIELTHPDLRVHVSPGGPDPDGAGPWQTTLMQPTKIAAREGFDLVVNGDFFRVPPTNAPERLNPANRAANWSSVSGPAASTGRVWSTSRNRRPCLAVDRSGTVAIKMLSRPETNAWQVVSGNTMLITNGTAVPHENKVRHPRTAVGLNADATKLTILVVDGRKPGLAVGMSYDELTVELIRLGCHEALNLDGGGSSVMALRDATTGGYRILNQPTDGRERAVANVLGISVCATSGPPAAAASSPP
jgi:hypothetical protein